MKSCTPATLLMLGLATVGANCFAATPPKEENCHKAVEQGLDVLRHPAPNSRARDEARRKELLAIMEHLVDTSRQQGKTECETWGQMMKKAFTQ